MDTPTALVTGAAGGIGAAVAYALAVEGVAVAAVDSDAEGLASGVKELRSAGHRIVGYHADVCSSSEVDAVVDRAETELGPINQLVNSAGVLRTGEVLALSDADWNDVFSVNTTGVFHVSRAVAARMVPRRTGSIVTVASNAARTPRWNMAAYGASKAAAVSFTKTLGLELAQHGIRCNTVSPGSTETAMLTSLWSGDEARAASIGGVPETFRLGIPLGRLAQPGDVASAVLFLLSSQATHITLHDLTGDGGAVLGA